MPTQSFTVTGLNCEHCVASVTEELTELPGVREVTVDLATGRVEVAAESVLDDAQVRRAVTSAGFDVLSPALG